MKILHTSDWHLGKRLEGFSRLEEQKVVLKEICDIADSENVDAIVVAGDLFDTFNPPSEAVDLLYKSLKRLTNNGRRPVIAIAGNHDSPDRIEAPDPLARECGIIFAGYPNSIVPPFELETGLKVLNSCEGFIELKLPDNNVPLRILLTPYANEFRLKTFLGEEDSEAELRSVLRQNWQKTADKYCDDNGVNILLSHLFIIKKGAEAPEEPEDEKPILHVGGVQTVYTDNIPGQIQYAALGHLHRYINTGSDTCPVIYCGSPLAYSFAEADQKKYVIIVEAAAGEPVKIEKRELFMGKKLVRHRAEGVEAALEWLNENQDCLVELTLVTDTFLTAADRKRLSAAHDGIITVIPEVQNPDLLKTSDKKSVDPTRDMDDLFRDYFRYVKGQEPNEDIMKLFAEIQSVEDD